MKHLFVIEEAIMYHEFLKAEWEHKAFNGIRAMPEYNFMQGPSTSQEYPRKLERVPGSTLFRAMQRDIVEEILTKAAVQMKRGFLLSYLPRNIVWTMAAPSEESFKDIRIIKESTWRDVIDKYGGDSIYTIATGIHRECTLHGNHEQFDDHEHKIVEIFQSIISKKTVKLPKLILIGPNGQNKNVEGRYSALEGNHRAVAMVMAMIAAPHLKVIPKEIIIGKSSKIKECIWYNGQVTPELKK